MEKRTENDALSSTNHFLTRVFVCVPAEMWISQSPGLGRTC